MPTPYELEHMARQFLRENDPHFLRKNKNTTMEYPYLSPRQIQIRGEKEIPASALSNRQKSRVPKLGEAPTFDD